MGDNMSSFQKLPAEMLGYIFEECIEEDERKSGAVGLGVSPWLLAQVCRFWYQTAKGTPSLWRKILVTDSHECYWSLKRNEGRVPRHQAAQQGNPRSHSATQVCVNGVELKNALKRSGAASLEITLAFGGQWASKNQPGSAFYEELYNMIFDDSLSPRITHLVFEVMSELGGEWEWWSGEQLRSFSLLNSTFPNLISLQINSYAPLSTKMRNGTPMLKSILEGARKLQVLQVSKGPIPDELKYSVWSSSSYRSIIPNLRELRVGNGTILDQMLSGPLRIETLVIDTAVKAAATKEESVWGSRVTEWPTLGTASITFDRLTRLHLILDDFSHLDLLDLPLIEELRLMQSYQDRRTMQRNPNGYPPNRRDFTLDLPNLRTLRVRSPHITPLNRFKMPQLKNLHITSTRLAQGKADADFARFVSGPASSSGVVPDTTFIGARFLEGVEDLYINSLLSEKGSISTLKAFPSLRKLQLVPGNKIGKSLVQELTTSKHKQIAAGVLCPELVAIEIDCYSFQEYDNMNLRNKRVGTAMHEGLPGVIKKLAESRKKWGNQLECCTLIATDGNRYEYVEG
jgi:F-box-like